MPLRSTAAPLPLHCRSASTAAPLPIAAPLPQAHLFHVIDPHYHVPRWVLGPSPGNENGWAFCESDAPTPSEVRASWISWDGFEWHTSPSLRFVEPAAAGEVDEESDYEEETELEARFINEVTGEANGREGASSPATMEGLREAASTPPPAQAPDAAAGGAAGAEERQGAASRRRQPREASTSRQSRMCAVM